jgi:hypothetical protein
LSPSWHCIASLHKRISVQSKHGRSPNTVVVVLASLHEEMSVQSQSSRSRSINQQSQSWCCIASRARFTNERAVEVSKSTEASIAKHSGAVVVLHRASRFRSLRFHFHFQQTNTNVLSKSKHQSPNTVVASFVHVMNDVQQQSKSKSEVEACYRQTQSCCNELVVVVVKVEVKVAKHSRVESPY